MPGEPILAFDDIINGDSPVYSANYLDDVLAELESYTLEVIADRIGSTENITVQLETSADGRNWVEKNPGQPEVLANTSAAHAVFSGIDIGVRPALAFVRLRLKLDEAGSAKVRVHVREGPDAGFLPMSLAGCRAWLRADLGVTADANLNVSSWRDLTGHGFDATQATSTRQPLVATGATLVGGRPAVVFDASTAGQEKILTLGASLAGLASGHVFVIHKRASQTPGTAARAGFWTMGSSADAAHVPYTDSKVWDDCGATVRKDCGALTATLTSPSCYEVRSASGAWQNLINGTSQFSTATNTVGFASAPALGGNASVGSYFDGAIAELVVYDRVLSANERAVLVAYFKGRYLFSMT